MTTAELINEWMTSHEKEQVKAQTYSRYRGLIDHHIVPKLGDIEIADLTRRQIHDFLACKKREDNKRGGNLSATSVNMMLSILNMAFEYAYDLEMVKANPCDRLKRASNTDSKRVEAFTKAEQRRIEQTIDS